MTQPGNAPEARPSQLTTADEVNEVSLKDSAFEDRKGRVLWRMRILNWDTAATSLILVSGVDTTTSWLGLRKDGSQWLHPYKCWNAISKQLFHVLQPSCLKSEARIKSSGSFPPWLHVAAMRKHHVWVSWQNNLIECEHSWRLATPSRFVSHRRAHKAAGRLPGSPSTGEPEPTAAPLRPPERV